MNLVLLGNGFDLSLGLPTSYIDFLDTMDFILANESDSCKTVADIWCSKQLRKRNKNIANAYDKYKGCRAKITKQATLNGKRFRSTRSFLTFRLFSLIRHALRRATFPVGEGDLRRGLHSSGPGFHFQGSPPHPSRLRRSTLSKQERATSRRGKAQRAFSGPCVFWHCMVQCPKNRQAPGGKGGFFCPVSRPSRPLWSPL